MDLYPIEEYTRKIGTATTLSKKQDASFNNCVNNFNDLLLPLLKELNQIETEIGELNRQHQVDVERAWAEWVICGIQEREHGHKEKDGNHKANIKIAIHGVITKLSEKQAPIQSSSKKEINNDIGESWQLVF